MTLGRLILSDKKIGRRALSSALAGQARRGLVGTTTAKALTSSCSTLLQQPQSEGSCATKNISYNHHHHHQQQQRRSFHFATRDYAACFHNLPEPDPAYFRAQAVEYLSEGGGFDPQVWYDEPICSILNGKKLTNGEVSETTNSLGQVNGQQIFSTEDEMAAIEEHLSTYKSPVASEQRDLIRQVEEDLFTNYAGLLIGNQCVDFCKQDGVTEIEEAVMANTVERRLNDQLLRDEAAGILQVNRQPIYVAAVSNFSNFLDLSRKTIRSLEVGIPVVILGRSHTSQHVFRWTELLLQLTTEHGMDPGMITYVSCPTERIGQMLQNCQAHTGNLYATCSRQLAQTLTSTYPKTVASTGGPNTLVVTSNISIERDEAPEGSKGGSNGKTAPTDSLTKAVQAAIRTSAAIESAGQCTALRHCVVPTNTTDETLVKLWGSTVVATDPGQALKDSKFDGVFAHTATPTPPADKYSNPPGHPDVYYKVSDALPVEPLDEYWRHVSVDFTKLDLANSEDDRSALCAWLNTHQPISLAVNGPRAEVLEMGLELFDRTGLVVYTLGSTDTTDSMPPAFTCQARPQDGECFGEFPPRSTLEQHTQFPVIVPSSNPSYGATYTDAYLHGRSVSPYWSQTTQALVQAISNDKVRGFVVALIEYLRAVDTQNPRVGRTSETRTAVWGLQNPPADTAAFVYAAADATWDAVAPLFTLYYVTSARDQMILTIHPDNIALIDLCTKHELPHTVATREEWQAQVDAQPAGVFLQKAIEGGASGIMSQFPMAYLFTLKYLPAGHIKSTAPRDDEFLFRFQGLSKKWLSTLF